MVFSDRWQREVGVGTILNVRANPAMSSRCSVYPLFATFSIGLGLELLVRSDISSESKPHYSTRAALR